MKSKKSTRRRRIVATQKHKSKSGKRHVSRKTRKSRSVRGGKISTGALVGTTALLELARTLHTSSTKNIKKEMKLCAHLMHLKNYQ